MRRFIKRALSRRRRTGTLAGKRLRMEFLEPRLMLTAESEPNDTLATARTFLTPTDSLDGSIGSAADVDYFKATLTQGQSLTIRPGATDIYAGLGADDPGQLHYAPDVQLLNSAGNMLGSSSDGRDIVYLAPSAGTYYVRIDAAAIYGTFAGGYRVPVDIANFAGTIASESNNTTSTADAAGPIDNFR